jgi:hypothetical protein
MQKNRELSGENTFNYEWFYLCSHVGWFRKTGLLLHFPSNLNSAADLCTKEMEKRIIFMYLGGNAVIDAFQLPTSAGRGHIRKDSDENVYFSF